MEKLVLGEFYGFTLICEGNLFGGISIWAFLRVWVGSRVDLLRRGDRLCIILCVWGNFRCYSLWGGLVSEGARVYLETTEQGRGS
jgi:hypothetical protein